MIQREYKEYLEKALLEKVSGITDIYKIIKIIIKERKTTLVELSEIIGVSRSKLIRGIKKVPCDKDIIVKTILALNIEPMTQGFILFMSMVNIYTNSEEDRIYRYLLDELYKEKYINIEKKYKILKKKIKKVSV